MREIQINLVCDWHLAAEDVRVEAVEEREITVDRGKTKVVAACQECASGWMEAMRLAVEDAQTKDERPKRQGKRPEPASTPATAVLDCPWPRCDRVGERGFNGRTALGMHMTRTHETPLTQWEAMDSQQRRDRVVTKQVA